MEYWDGRDRREGTNLDWLQHKETILGQLRELKQGTKETDEKVTTMQVSLAVLNTKLMVASAVSSFIVATVVSVLGLVLKS